LIKDYNIEIYYHPSKSNIVANALEIHYHPGKAKAEKVVFFVTVASVMLWRKNIFLKKSKCKSGFKLETSPIEVRRLTIRL
jgi:hypothetical protein